MLLILISILNQVLLLCIDIRKNVFKYNLYSITDNLDIVIYLRKLMKTVIS